jgi:hypothetical protein
MEHETPDMIAAKASVKSQLENLASRIHDHERLRVQAARNVSTTMRHRAL